MQKMSKIEREKQTVGLMIHIYCRRSEGNSELCQTCQNLLDYAFARLDRCPYGEAKPACKKCPTHCYKPAMRDFIRKVMRFSGPRMIFYRPIEAMKQIFDKF